MKCKTCQYCKTVFPIITHKCTLKNNYVEPNDEQCKDDYVKHSSVIRIKANKGSL